MSNPNPEIAYDLAVATRSDLIMATGRSDYPNQINNVLGFPFIFRGALDVRAKTISEGMKMAAAKALASLAKEPVPEIVRKAYAGKEFSFGRNYIVPKPFDPRVIEWEAVAVARAACDEGLALHPITDWDAYREGLRKRMAHYWN
jgi:malate dehydrogenase (oxaloacetate-decarboxylating)(NADP+)